MCQNSMSNSPGGNTINDYSLQSAATGMVAIAAANAYLDGTGVMLPVITGALNGTKIKSVKIVATAPTLQGMVRLFIFSGVAGDPNILYAEIPIPRYPELSATPTPTPIMSMFEATLTVDWDLPQGAVLLASTQTANTFNIFAEGVNWTYPDTLPDSCCSYAQNIAVSGSNVVSVANTRLDGGGPIVNIYQAAISTYIKTIAIKAQQSTNEGMVRLFLSPDGSNYFLYQEIYVPPTTQSGFIPSFQIAFNDLIHYIKEGYYIAASTNNAESFSIVINGTTWSYPIS